MVEMLEEQHVKEFDSFVEEDYLDARKEKDAALTVTPQAKEAFSRKPYYMYTSGSKIKKVKK